MNNVPIFLKEKISFMREEKERNYTIVLKEFPELQELLINRTAYEVFNLCNGKNTLDEIIKTFKSKYSGVPEKKLINDICLILSRFYHFGVIEWEEGNDPFIISNEKYLENNYKLRLAVDRDYPLLKDYLEKNRQNLVVFEKGEELGTVDLKLKFWLFSRQIDFYLLLNSENQILALIGVGNRNPQQKSTSAEIMFMSNCSSIEEKDHLTFLMHYFNEFYNDYAPTKVHKFTGKLNSNNPNYQIVKDVLLSDGYQLVGVLRKEYENDEDCTIFEKLF